METLGVTHSVCEVCRALAPAKIVSDEGLVYFDKFCPEHGPTRHRVRADVDEYLSALRYVRPAWQPAEFAGRADAPCPQGCGYCERHEQHLCLPIIELTSRCDLNCPVCLVEAGGVPRFHRAWRGADPDLAFELPSLQRDTDHIRWRDLQ